MILLGLALIFLVMVFAIIFGVMKMKNMDYSNEKRIDDMFKSFYLYLVLFATLMMSIGGSVGVFMSIADYVSPPAYYQSFEDYKMMYVDQEVERTSEELRVAYDDMIFTEKQQEKENALNSIIKSLGWVVIPFPIFLLFQRQLRKGKDE